MPHQPVFQAAQEFLTREELPGWLIFDYRHSNPIFRQVVTPSGHVTRPCFLHIPSAGAPRLLVHYVDAGKFLDCGLDLVVYSSRQKMLEGLKQVLSGTPRVAMEYSPQNALPRVSRVDAGTVELVRSLGVEVVSSADLMQYATQRWTPAQLAGHQRAAAKLGTIVNQAFRRIGQTLSQGPSEYTIAEYIRQRFREEGLTTTDGPIVAANAHSSDPHYEPAAQGSSVIRPGDWVLIDLWAREETPGSVYADITWVALVGDKPTPHHQEIFNIVAGARDAALQHLQEAHRQGLVVQGWQADAVARNYIAQRGYGAYFTHRLGHSISYEVHGEAVNLDGYETHDTRTIIPGIGFSIEPGIYLPEFGVRSEIDCYMAGSGPYASSPVQRDIVLIQGG
jgi:Xaa-Pro aminopeptidase